MELLSQHRTMLEASAISVEVAKARGYRSVTTQAELKRLGFGPSQLLAPTLVIPIWGANGEIVLHHHRPDTPRTKNGKTVKYEFPSGCHMAVDVHPTIRERVADPTVPLWITEGAKKADAAITLGLCCIALIGTWNWRGTNEFGGKTALPDWEYIALKDGQNQPRDVYICFDSDCMVKPEVHQALERLAAFLRQRGARGHFVYLPHGEHGQKVGLDDFLAQGHGVDNLLSLAASELRPLPAGSQLEAHSQYDMNERGTFHNRQTREGIITTQVANFTARIVGDIEEDDGVETRRLFEIEARLRERQRTVQVSSSEFGAMNWPTAHLGAGATISAGMGAKDHVRAAIQFLSPEPVERSVFSHLGWRKLRDGKCVYLHAGGGIGEDGPVEVQVHVTGGLRGYELPLPLDGDERIEAVRASLAMLDLAADHITVPVLGSVYRSVLGPSDHSVHIAGPTGTFKTELAALAQQHFGASMDRLHLPENWSSTDNALEAAAFLAKDALMVIDDFAPGGSQRDVDQLHRKADRVLRAQGNRSGRRRMAADGTLREPRPPRGTLMSTGEDVPAGASLRARMIVVEIEPDAVRPDALTRCQELARSGVYAQAMACFIRWLATNLDSLLDMMPRQIANLRNLAASDTLHRRTPEVVASVAFGIRTFVLFAADVGVISPDERAALWDRCWNALCAMASAQESHQAASEPTRRFLELLQAALASGRAHVAALDGREPDNPSAWGWREREVAGHTEMQPLGDRIGWVDGTDLYLQPDAAHKCASRMGGEGADRLAIGSKTLNKRLDEKGLLVSTEPDRKTRTIRKVIEGERRDVLHLRASSIYPRESAQSAQSDHAASRRTSADAARDGQFGQNGQIPGEDAAGEEGCVHEPPEEVLKI